MAMSTKEQEQSTRSRLITTLLLVLLALVGISAASYAWFSISDNARSTNMQLDVVADNTMRFDLDAHDTFDEYVKTLSFAQIGARMASDYGFDADTAKLEPVTTSDYSTFTYRDGTEADKTTGAYLEFTLHFMSEKGCVVHLSSADGDNGEQGTAFSSSVEGLAGAMRMSFTADGQTWVYDPDMEAVSQTDGSVTTFGLPSSANMVADDSNSMFTLEAGVDKPVVVRIWMEGTDSDCTNELKGADYSVTMRFEGVRVISES